MRVFISYAWPDKQFVRRLVEALKKSGVKTWVDDLELRPGDNIWDKVGAGLRQADAIVVVLSRAYSESKSVKRELGAFEVNDAEKGERRILPVLKEDCEIPVILQSRLFADFRSSFDAGFQQLLRGIANAKHGRKSTSSRQPNNTSTEFQLKELREQFVQGNLSLFCGAGVSVDAGVPAWTVLLQALLGCYFGSQEPERSVSESSSLQLAGMYQKCFQPSSLVIGQYLKNGLGDDFLQTVRDALYKGQPTSCPLIDSIVELCRPQRSGIALRSIVTFNFDDLIESNLDKQRIQHKSIYREGQRCPASKMPIYHVHGFLPRSGSLKNEHQIVFSEDAYHSQFIDPFSWSNLIQLTHLSQHQCLFVGISLADPNLRRLLDVAMRKNPSREANHYLMRKRHDHEEILAKVKGKAAKRLAVERGRKLVALVEDMEEQDANKLGLKVIWVDDYDDIPPLLNRLVAE